MHKKFDEITTDAIGEGEEHSHRRCAVTPVHQLVISVSHGRRKIPGRKSQFFKIIQSWLHIFAQLRIGQVLASLEKQ